MSQIKDVALLGGGEDKESKTMAGKQTTITVILNPNSVEC